MPYRRGGLTDGGALWVGGDADGPVEIVASGEQTFDVIDNGQTVATVENVETNIVVSIDQGTEPASNDRVSIALGDQTIDNVLVRMGNGDNNFAIAGDEPVDRVLFRGGDGADQAIVDVDTEFLVEMLMRQGDDAVLQTGDANRIRFYGSDGDDSFLLDADANAEIIAAGLGHGDNNFNIEGDIGQRLHVRGGENADRVLLNAQSDIGGLTTINLGHGENRLVVAGTIEGSLLVRGGSGNDSVSLADTSDVTRRVGMVLGTGDNDLNLAGSIGNNVFLRGFGGNDDFRIDESSEIGGSVRALMGDGENRFLHAGQIDGNLFVVSKNANDQFVVAGNVEDVFSWAPVTRADPARLKIPQRLVCRRLSAKGLDPDPALSAYASPGW